MDDEIRHYALINAVDHEGTASAKSVLGKLLAEKPELRSDVLGIKSKVDAIVEEINRLGIEEQRKELGEIPAPEKRVERKGLPELERKNKFVVRFAPNPDGALHLGNARPAVLCDEYAKKYKGKFILRFDDTDPKVKIPEKRFYSWIKEDLKWLKIRWHKEITASRRLNIYYKYARLLIEKNGAYICTCGEEWKEKRNKGTACSCRSDTEKENLRKFGMMLKHKYKEGHAVLRIKTDMQHRNPAVRDWPAMRIVDKPVHPLSKKHVWPLYNLASAIDDRLLGVTHILRGQEHSTNEVKQRFLYQHMRWEYPAVVTLGRFSLSGMVLSKSQIREGIARREFTNWDDLRLGTLRALRRRGFHPDALRQIIIDVGPKPSDITISMENLSAYNRKLIDKTSNRYFFVPDPKKIVVRDIKIKKARIPLHPESKRGFRTFSLSNVFYIDSKDFDSYKGLEVRLKDLCNIKLGEKSVFTSSGVKSIPKIQWVPAKHITVSVIAPEREINGYGEINISRAKPGSVVQFERFGFVRIEKSGRNLIMAVFCHE